MKRINLQMFAHDSNSIVDYLKSTGQDSSYSARKELAEKMGISNYSGSASQNTQMLNELKGGSSGSKNTGVTPSPSANAGPGASPGPAKGPGGTSNDALLSQIESMLSDFAGSGGGGGGGSYKQSEASKKAQAEAQKKLEELNNMTVENVVSKNTWDKINTPFSASSAYQDAMNYTNELLQQLSSGRTSYTDQIKDMLNQIQNRDPFSYDMSNDTLFQQSLASAMASGKTAMQDTMGQASALTGGYGSTYATSAANQTYNQFIEDAYNNLPEYYEMALQAYQMEGNEMYNQLAALSTADASEYERMYNSWNSNFQNAQQMYQNEYTKWQDEIGTAFNNAQLQLQEHGALYDQAYKSYMATLGLSDSTWSQEFNKWNAESDLAYKYDSLAQDKEQYASDLQYKYDSLAQNQSQFDKEMALQYDKLKQDQAQFEAKMIQDQKQFEAKLENPDNPKYDSLSTAEINGIKTTYQEALNSGATEEQADEAVQSYLNHIGKNPNPSDTWNLLSTIKPKEKGIDDVPFYNMTWTLASDGSYSNGSTTMTYKQLEKALKDTDLDPAQKQMFLEKLKAQQK